MIKKIKATEQRHFIRHPMCFPLKFRVLKDKGKERSKEERSRTINIGRGGLLFSAKIPVSVHFLIMIKIPFQEKVFNVKAKVVHCSRNAETKLYDIGTCFVRASDSFKVKLIEQLYLISEYRDLRSIQLGREVSLHEASSEWVARYSERFRRLYW